MSRRRMYSDSLVIGAITVIVVALVIAFVLFLDAHRPRIDSKQRIDSGCTRAFPVAKGDRCFRESD